MMSDNTKTIIYPIWLDMRRHLFSVGDIIGAFSMWAIRQSPYYRPDNLEQAIDELGELLMQKLDFEPPYGYVSLSYAHIRTILMDCFDCIAAIKKWNEPKSGHNAQNVFVSRYSQPRPDDDFIDLDALARNIAETLIQERLVDEDR